MEQGTSTPVFITLSSPAGWPRRCSSSSRDQSRTLRHAGVLTISDISTEPLLPELSATGNSFLQFIDTGLPGAPESGDA
uniref:Uncharacterized protein n=1 Tax=Leclercia adecarboxylata TaxID=83655 RepID=A0A5B8KS77_9ENTR|nr:Hypothetical protein [Leclercia adecarboxylata]